MVQDRNFRGRRKLEPIKTCSTAVDHHQLVHALKSTSNLPVPGPGEFKKDTRKIPLAVPLQAQKSQPIGPPYPYAGAPLRGFGMGTNIHHLSKSTNDRINSAVQRRKRAVYTRQHENWSLPIYGNFTEREQFMQGYRSYLKSQMDEKSWRKRQEFDSSVQNTKKSWEETQIAIQADREADVTKKMNRRVYRDENKKLMEEVEEKKKLSQENTIEQERRLVKLDPINWSRTLR